MFTGNYGSNRANTATYEGGFEKGHEDIIRAKGRMRIIQCPVLGSKLGTAWFPQQCFPPTPAAPARSSRQVMSARAPLSSHQMGFGAAAAFSLGCCPKQSLLLRHVCFHTLQMMVSDLNPPTWCWNLQPPILLLFLPPSGAGELWKAALLRWILFLPSTLGVSHLNKAVVVWVVISFWKLHSHVSYSALTRWKCC